MSDLKQKIDADQFVVTSELNPPKGTDLDDLLVKARSLKHAVDAINLTDNAGARAAMTPLAASVALLREGIEPICQMTARDMNRLGFQSRLLGAAALGIRNAVFMGGDPPSVGDQPDAKPVFDILAVEMLSTAQQLCDGVDMAGNTLQGAPSMYLGGVVNPFAADMSLELDKLDAKIDAGARFVQSQAVYDVAAFEQFMQRIESRKVAVLAGIIPIKSVAMANYMNERIPGVHIPEPMINAVAKADNVAAHSIQTAATIASEVRQCCQGVHIMAIGWEAHIPDIVAAAGLNTH